MNRRLGALIAAVAFVSGLLLVSAVLLCPLGWPISITPGSHAQSEIVLGLVFWVALTLVGSSLAVRMPSGSVLDVAFAPVIAALSLGGPAAAAFVGLLGTTQGREMRREVPWYGVLANHCAIMSPAILGAFALQLVPSRTDPRVDFIATVGAAAIYFSLNVLITATFVSLRDGEPVTKQLRIAGGAYLNMLALAPVAWLMALTYATVGWWAAILFAVPVYTSRLAYRRFVEVRAMFTETVSSLAAAVDKRDKFSGDHSRRVQEIAMDIGRAMKVSEEDLEALEWGGLLHDIGKIGVPDSVLLKQERLTRDERAQMNSHPVLGAEIIGPVTHLARELPIILHHHEWFNGSGYPDRLMGDEIPALARILHVADAFEAMTAQRPYRMTPLTPEQALGELRKFGGVQFDPAVVDAFIRTKWARGVKDPGSDESRDVPMIGQAAGSIGLAVVPTTSGTAS
jgi:putative nucleotidyltransferase with HDIG domain